MTKSWKRQNPLCKRQLPIRTCPFIPTSRVAWGSSDTCCSSCPDPDTGLIDMAESGFHTGVFEPIQFSSRRTSTPSSFRSSKVTTLKANRRAFGRRSVARTENRDPCLCSDSTIANVNAKVQIEEKSFNPCVEDITSSKVVSHPS